MSLFFFLVGFQGRTPAASMVSTASIIGNTHTHTHTHIHTHTHTHAMYNKDIALSGMLLNAQEHDSVATV